MKFLAYACTVIHHKDFFEIAKMVPSPFGYWICNLGQKSSHFSSKSVGPKKALLMNNFKNTFSKHSSGGRRKIEYMSVKEHLCVTNKDNKVNSNSNNFSLSFLDQTH